MNPGFSIQSPTLGDHQAPLKGTGIKLAIIQHCSVQWKYAWAPHQTVLPPPPSITSITHPGQIISQGDPANPSSSPLREPLLTSSCLGYAQRCLFSSGPARSPSFSSCGSKQNPSSDTNEAIRCFQKTTAAVSLHGFAGPTLNRLLDSHSKDSSM